MRGLDQSYGTTKVELLEGQVALLRMTMAIELSCGALDESVPVRDSAPPTSGVSARKARHGLVDNVLAVAGTRE